MVHKLVLYVASVGHLWSAHCRASETSRDVEVSEIIAKTG